MSARPKQYLIVATDGRLLGSNVSIEGAAHTARHMGVGLALAILDSRTALVVDRVST